MPGGVLGVFVPVDVGAGVGDPASGTVGPASGADASTIGTHEPVLHSYPVTQSTDVVHVVLHAPAPHAYGAHDV